MSFSRIVNVRNPTRAPAIHVDMITIPPVEISITKAPSWGNFDRDRRKNPIIFLYFIQKL